MVREAIKKQEASKKEHRPKRNLLESVRENSKQKGPGYLVKLQV